MVTTKFKTSAKMLEWQYFQILGDLGEIQRHDSDPTCPCRLSEDLGENCLAKHSLELSRISAETAAMETDKKNADILWGLSAEAKEKHEKIRGFLCHKEDEPEFTEWSRQWRKKIEPIYYGQCHVKKGKLRDALPEIAALMDAGPTVYVTGTCGKSLDTCTFTIRRRGKSRTVTKQVKVAKSKTCTATNVKDLAKETAELLAGNSCALLKDVMDAELAQDPTVKISGKCTADGCSLKVKGAVETIEATDAPGLSSAIKTVIKHFETQGSRPAVATDKTFAMGITTSTRYEFEWQIIDGHDLVVSNDPFTFAPNPKYIRALQPRERGRAATKLQVETIASKLSPDLLLLDFLSLDKGSPIIGPDNLVECGNGRVMGIIRAARDNPDKFAAYRERLKKLAPQYGLSAKIVETMQVPILVRVRLTNVDRQAFAEECNARTGIQSSAIENARSDAEKITPEMLAGLDVLEGEIIENAIRATRNKPFVVAFLSKLPANEQAGLVDSKGVLSQDGVRRLVTAIFLATFRGDVGMTLGEKFFEATEADVKNVFAGILRALAPLARAETLTATGQREAEYAFGDDLAKVIGVYSRIKSMPNYTVAKYMAQMSLQSRELNPFQERVLQVLDTNSRSAKRIGQILSNYGQAVIDSPAPGQGSFMAMEKATKMDLFESAVKHALAALEDIARLFQDTEAPWQFTFDQYIRSKAEEMADRFKMTGEYRARYIKRFLRSQSADYQTIHHRSVAAAIAVGKPVPQIVRGEYPDLEMQAIKVESSPFRIGNKTFEISPQVVDSMNVLINRTNITGKEHAMDMCQNKEGVLIPGMACKGAACSVHIHDCANLTKIADFHTHPGVHDWKGKPLPAETSIIPSGQDVMNTRGGVSCVGSPFTDKVNCWTRKPIPAPAYYCPKKRSWSYVTTDLPPDLVQALKDSNMLCTGVKEGFDFTTINRKEETDAARHAEDKKTEATKENQEVKPVEVLPSGQARLFDYSWLIKKLNCPLSPADANQALNWRPLREFLAWATGIGKKVELCAAGMVQGAYQIVVYDVDELNIKAQATKRAQTVPNMVRVWTPYKELVYTVVLPESQAKELTWEAQEVQEGPARKEPAEQAAMFDSEADREGLRLSIAEEMQAIESYEKRSRATANVKINRLYGHITGEEWKHYEEFKKLLAELERKVGSKAKLQEEGDAKPVDRETIKTEVNVTTPSGKPVKIHISGNSSIQTRAVAEVGGKTIPLAIHMGGLLTLLSAAQEKQTGITGGMMLRSSDFKTGIALAPDQAREITKAWEDHQAEVSKQPAEVMRHLISERDKLADDISGILDDIRYKREQAFREDIGNIPSYDSPKYRDAVNKLKDWDDAHPGVVAKIEQDRQESLQRHQWD